MIENEQTPRRRSILTVIGMGLATGVTSLFLGWCFTVLMVTAGGMGEGFALGGIYICSPVAGLVGLIIGATYNIWQPQRESLVIIILSALVALTVAPILSILYAIFLSGW